MPQPADFDEALLIVRMRDTAMSDAPAPLIAITRRVVTGCGIQRIPFVMRLRRKIPSRAIPALEAELRAEGGRTLAPGDWLTVSHVPYEVGRHTGLQVSVERIR